MTEGATGSDGPGEPLGEDGKLWLGLRIVAYSRSGEAGREGSNEPSSSCSSSDGASGGERVRLVDAMLDQSSVGNPSEGERGAGSVAVVGGELFHPKCQWLTIRPPRSGPHSPGVLYIHLAWFRNRPLGRRVS